MITNSSIGGYGRLGNQMFQFSFLYGQCQWRGGRAFINHENGGYDLGHFDLQADGIVRTLPDLEYSATYEKEIVANWPERSWAYESEIAFGADRCDFHGYFQSARYFSGSADGIRRAFRFLDPPSPEVSRWVRLIERSIHPVVGVHVRLGDYVHQSWFHTNLHRTDYYDRALSTLRAELGTPFTPFVFSDDIGWCESSGLFSGWDGVRFVSGLDHIGDLRLLCRCRHHVIANSSFSWWGAWLASHPVQIVIAPESWFGEKSGMGAWESVYLDNWIRLPSKKRT